MDLHGRVKIHAILTKAYEDVKFATNVGSDLDVMLSSESPENFLPQRKRPAQRPRIDLRRYSKAVAAKTLALKFRSPGACTTNDAC